jgi:hypothetical protein
VPAGGRYVHDSNGSARILAAASQADSLGELPPVFREKDSNMDMDLILESAILAKRKSGEDAEGVTDGLFERLILRACIDLA